MLLEAKNIGYAYNKEQWVLRKIHLSIAAGEVVGLMGESGCGKTTLARILAGYLLPHEGRVLLDGNPLPTTGYTPVQLVFQHPEKAVNPRFTMTQVLAESLFPEKELLELLHIETEWLKRRPNELSGGELQRFCLARVLKPATRLLIADEMTAMLDALTQAQLWQAVLDFAAKQSIGVLVISHEAALLERICARIIKLEKITVLPV